MDIMPESKNPAEMEWMDPPRNYYLSDVKEKVLHHNPETGFKIALVKTPIGVMDKLHKHTEANQYVLRLTGEPMWGFGYWPKGEIHGGSNIKEETVALFIWDGTPKPEVVE